MITTIQASKTLLAQLPRPDFEALVNAQNYQHIQNVVRKMGMFNLLLGALTLGLGLNSLQQTDNVLHIIQAVAGALLMLFSLWSIVRPSGVALVVLGWVVVLGIFSLFNLFVVTLEWRGGRAIVMLVLPLLLSVLQLRWARRVERTYREYASMRPTPPTAATKALRETAQQAVKAVDFQADDDVIDFKLERRDHKAWLLNDYVYLTTNDGGNFYFINDYNNFKIAPLLPYLPDSPYSAVYITLVQQTYRGRISKQSFERYRNWHAARTAPEADPAR